MDISQHNYLFLIISSIKYRKHTIISNIDDYLSKNYTNYLLKFCKSIKRDKSWNRRFLTQFILDNHPLNSSIMNYLNVTGNRIAHRACANKSSKETFKADVNFAAQLKCMNVIGRMLI